MSLWLTDFTFSFPAASLRIINNQNCSPFIWVSLPQNRTNKESCCFQSLLNFRKIIFLSFGLGFCSTATSIANRLEKLQHILWLQSLILLFRILYYHIMFFGFPHFILMVKNLKYGLITGIPILYCIFIFAPSYILKTLRYRILKYRYSDYLALKTPLKRITNVHRNRSRNSLVLELLEQNQHQSVKVFIILPLSCINSQEVRRGWNTASTHV